MEGPCTEEMLCRPSTTPVDETDDACSRPLKQYMQFPINVINFINFVSQRTLCLKNPFTCLNNFKKM